MRRRGIIGAVAFLLAASTVLYADEIAQDWMPDVLRMPEDATVVADREIGTVRMFSITTAENVDELLPEWEESLRINGFPVSRGDGELIEKAIEFSGQGIVNAKIIVAPVTEDGLSLIEFDATLN